MASFLGPLKKAIDLRSRQEVLGSFVCIGGGRDVLSGHTLNSSPFDHLLISHTKPRYHCK